MWFLHNEQKQRTSKLNFRFQFAAVIQRILNKKKLLFLEDILLNLRQSRQQEPWPRA